MVILAIHLELVLPYVQGLKERRKVLHSMKERLKRLNASVIDLSSEYPKEAHLGMVRACGSEKSAVDALEHIRRFLDSESFEYEYAIQYEIY